jgi:uncharacterized membrane protein (DUF485 family)
MNNGKFLSWKKRNKMNIQIIALFLAIVFPFILYSALNNQWLLLAGFMFGGVTLAMVLVAALT